MSAFVVDHKTINIILTYLQNTQTDENHLRRPFIELGYDIESDIESLGVDLLAMNQDAVMYRYPDCDAMNLPGPVDPPDYSFRPEPASRVQVYKSATCLRYQCSEGNIPHCKLFHALNKFVHGLAYSIISKLPAYERAYWG